MAELIRDSTIRLTDREAMNEDCHYKGTRKIGGCMTIINFEYLIYLSDTGYSCRNSTPTAGHEFLHVIVEKLRLGTHENAEHTVPYVFANNPEDQIDGFNPATAEGRLFYHPSNFCGGTHPEVEVEDFL